MAVEWSTVERQVRSDDKGKFDIIIYPSGIEWIEDTTDIYLKVDGVGTFELSPWAESQMCSKLGIPVKYFRYSPGDLKNIQLDYWIRSLFQDKDRWLLRCKGSTIRGVLSDRYRPFDNHQLLELWKGLSIAHKYRYEYSLSDLSFYMRALPRNGNGRHDGLGGLCAGVYIANSEVGRRGVSIHATVWRQVCSNGLIAPVSATALYRRHIWLDADALANDFKQAVEDALQASKKSIKQLAAARDVSSSEEELMSELARIESTAFEDYHRTLALDAFRREREHNLFGVVNTLTELAQGLPPDDRFELEARAGRLLERVG